MEPQIKNLILLAQSGDDQAYRLLVEKNNGLIWSIVRRYIGRTVETEDLYQIGCMGFIKAVQRFDMRYATEFSTYAVPMIAGEIKRYLRDDGILKISRSTKESAIKIGRARQELIKSLGREPKLSEISQAVGLTSEEIAACETAVLPAASLSQTIYDDGPVIEDLIGTEGIEENIAETVDLKTAVAKLPPEQQKLIALRYFHGFTQTKTAKILGISQVQVSRLEKKVLLQLKTLME